MKPICSYNKKKYCKIIFISSSDKIKLNNFKNLRNIEQKCDQIHFIRGHRFAWLEYGGTRMVRLEHVWCVPHNSFDNRPLLNTRSTTGVLLFFGSAAVTFALLINLSSKWCDLLKKWEQVEGYFGHQKNLKLKFTFISVLCIIFSMG